MWTKPTFMNFIQERKYGMSSKGESQIVGRASCEIFYLVWI